MSPTFFILVTGSAGRIGQAVVKELKRRGHRVRGLDVRANLAADENLLGSISDAALFQRAATGTEVMIHLAATPDDDDFLTKLVPNNIVGVYNALEAARLAGVRRTILASSGQVVWWQRLRGPFPIGVDVPPTPRGWYASTKLFAEAAGRAMAESHGMNVLAVRLGWCPRDRSHARELADTSWGPDVYLSPGDAGRFFASAAESPKRFAFGVVYAYSKSPHVAAFDCGPTVELTGFEPQDTWPEGAFEDMH